MTILFLGNFRVHYCSEVHYSRTLMKMGHKVIQMQESEVKGDDLIREAKQYKPDYFFWVHTHGWQTPQLDNALLYFKGAGIPTFGYHLDLYVGLERQPRVYDYIAKLDYFFTVDKVMADLLNLDSAVRTKVFYLPAGVFADECYMAEPDYVRFPHPVIFTGAKGYHPEYPYRPQLIEWLHDTYKDQFAHYGNGGKPVQRGHDLNTLYASAKVVVGDTLCLNFKYPYYFSDRLFEAPGRGAFMIFPQITGIEMMYDPFKELMLYKYGDFADLKKKIDYYLNHEVERKQIQILGHERAKGSHTYTHRLTQLLEILEKEKATV